METVTLLFVANPTDHSHCYELDELTQTRMYWHISEGRIYIALETRSFGILQIGLIGKPGVDRISCWQDQNVQFIVDYWQPQDMPERQDSMQSVLIGNSIAAGTAVTSAGLFHKFGFYYNSKNP